MVKSSSNSGRQKIYFLLIAVLLLVYGVKFMNVDNIVLPTSQLINNQKQKIKQLKAELANLEKLVEKRKEKKDKIRKMVAKYWQSTNKIPTNVIQQKIERLGKKNDVTLNKVGAPKIVEISDNIRAVDITVSSTTSVKNVSDFLKDIENEYPVLVWHSCVIRPNRTKEPTAINISGKLRAYVMEPTVEQYTSGNEL